MIRSTTNKKIGSRIIPKPILPMHRSRAAKIRRSRARSVAVRFGGIGLGPGEAFRTPTFVVPKNEGLEVFRCVELSAFERGYLGSTHQSQCGFIAHPPILPRQVVLGFENPDEFLIAVLDFAAKRLNYPPPARDKADCAAEREEQIKEVHGPVKYLQGDRLHP